MQNLLPFAQNLQKDVILSDPAQHSPANRTILHCITQHMIHEQRTPPYPSNLASVFICLIEFIQVFLGEQCNALNARAQKDTTRVLRLELCQ